MNKMKLLAAKIRLDILKMLEHRGYGHMGGSLSIVEILAVLYGKHLRYRPSDPDWKDRDYFVLSKGHAGPALYSALCNVGFFDRQLLYTLNEGDTLLPSHPDRLKTPGVDVTTGSLGQGVSFAAGVAQALKMENRNQYVYVVVGDGELNEGQCWEAFQFIAARSLNNCIVIIDENKRQLDGYTEKVMNPFDISKKMAAFGFKTLKVKGDDLAAIDDALIQAKQTKDKAVCLVLDTVKGQGVKFFEHLSNNHSVKFNEELISENHKAVEELERTIRGYRDENK